MSTNAVGKQPVHFDLSWKKTNVKADDDESTGLVTLSPDALYKIWYKLKSVLCHEYAKPNRFLSVCQSI